MAREVPLEIVRFSGGVAGTGLLTVREFTQPPGNFP
jgi:hypothetical protein